MNRAALLFCLASWLCTQASVHATEPMAEAAAFWEGIRKVDGIDLEDLDEYWAKMFFDCYERFGRLDDQTDPKLTIDYYVDQFGKHGAHADVRWAAAAPLMMLPHHDEKRLDALQREKDKKLVMYASRRIVEKCLKDPVFLTRYYRLIVWSGFFLGASQAEQNYRVGQVYQGLPEKLRRANDGYWWHARNFVILAHATGRDDLLKDAKPGELEATFLVYEKWLKEKIFGATTDPKHLRWEVPKDAVFEVPDDPSHFRLPPIVLPMQPFIYQGEKPWPPPRSVIRIF